ncbi:PaaX family transcriptional regulator [Herbiconiux daphne]|uniref:Phenylacetic acid-responsive transcriptional repressor n=1 Tax=Herbiconiux daphne TaxID=2970914 RepID=A0ABT2H3R5_9MICO|nr:PaaX family transcriptional regulator C-terminal domain-containing protein [Herbiconiux daphne]MCS5734547.1 phenylacetic acid-responsive transcriptional repressor [Herbiconiux daphne]
MMTNEEKVRSGALVIDLLGDFNRIGGRELRLKALVELGEQLGIAGPTMRVTLARLRERGWFDVEREGRESIYRLSPLALVAIHEGGQRLHRPAPERWAGEWSMVIYTVPESDRQTRDELRRQLAWLGFGPLAPATWIRPRPQLDDIANAVAALSAARLTLLTTRTSGLAEDRAIAARCWDLDALGADYSDFIRDVRAKLPSYREAALDGREALVARIQLVHAYRSFTRRDPQFPVDLQPAGWQGDEARRLFEDAHSLLSEGSADYYARVLDLGSVSAD